MFLSLEIIEEILALRFRHTVFAKNYSDEPKFFFAFLPELHQHVDNSIFFALPYSVMFPFIYGRAWSVIEVPLFRHNSIWFSPICNALTFKAFVEMTKASLCFYS